MTTLNASGRGSPRILTAVASGDTQCLSRVPPHHFSLSLRLFLYYDYFTHLTNYESNRLKLVFHLYDLQPKRLRYSTSTQSVSRCVILLRRTQHFQCSFAYF
jgi:hypothetical protein